MHRRFRNMILIAALVMMAGAATSAVWSSSDGPANSAAATRPILRQPGFIFLELETPKVDDYAAFFRHVAEFHVVHNQPGYTEMESTCGQLLLIDPALIPGGHPFHGQVKGDANGIGVEMGFVVADLDKAFAAAKAQPGWRISSGIARRPWGVRDFRVLSPDGYYLRFTEGN